MEPITLILSSDNDYAPYLGVCLQSIIVNTSKSKQYQIYVLDGGISLKNKEKILRQQITNVKIDFVNMGTYIQNYPSDIFHICKHYSIATYYRFFLPGIFPKLDKVLYVDCDAVILKDVAELYQKDISDVYLAATREIDVVRIGAKKEKKYLDYFYKTLKLEDHTQYFQAGCMLLNLKKMREDNLTDKLINRLLEIKTPKFADQCILNSVCCGHVSYFEQNWNFTWHTPFIDEQYKEHIPEPYKTMYLDAQKNPYMIHFAGEALKPWINPTLEKAEYFWFYARQTSFYEEILYNNNVRMIKEVANYSKNCFYYSLYRLITHLTFGDLRERCNSKKKKLKAIIKEVRKILKGK